MTKISRHTFLRLAAAGLGSFTAAPLLTACGQPLESGVPSPSPAVTTSDIANTIRRPEIIRFWPDVKSKVVHTRHAGAWKGTPQEGGDDNALLNPEILRQMLDASIINLTGLDSARKAWAALFTPQERIAIKVNTLYGGLLWTHVPLTMAVAGCLLDAGVPAEQIVIYDRSDEELRRAGFTVNRNGSGVRCYGTADTWGEAKSPAGDSFTSGGSYTGGWKAGGKDIRLSDILLQSDALINMSILRVHQISGVSFAMKNHFGTIDQPWDLHDSIRTALADVNALPPIKARTRLVIGDVLAVNAIPYNEYPWTKPDVIGDSILMSYDPVAHDRTGFQILENIARETGHPLPSWAKYYTDPWLREGARQGLGTDDPNHIDFVEFKVE
jgi:hypothetical protein